MRRTKLEYASSSPYSTTGPPTRRQSGRLSGAGSNILIVSFSVVASLGNGPIYESDLVV